MDDWRKLSLLLFIVRQVHTDDTMFLLRWIIFAETVVVIASGRAKYIVDNKVFPGTVTVDYSLNQNLQYILIVDQQQYGNNLEKL